MDCLNIAIAYADLQGQYYQELTVKAGTTIHQALLASGVFALPNLSVFEQWCQDNLQTDPNHKAWYVGIYSIKKRLDTVLVDGDRIEIYRPLSCDPMARRKAKSGKPRRSAR